MFLIYGSVMHIPDTNVMFYAIWYHLYNFKNVKNNHGGMNVTFLNDAAFQPATLRKVTLLHGCFSRF